MDKHKSVWDYASYGRCVLVDEGGEIVAEVGESWPPGVWEYRGRRFTCLEMAKKAAEADVRGNCR